MHGSLVTRVTTICVEIDLGSYTGCIHMYILVYQKPHPRGCRFVTPPPSLGGGVTKRSAGRGGLDVSLSFLDQGNISSDGGLIRRWIDFHPPTVF